MKPVLLLAVAACVAALPAAPPRSGLKHRVHAWLDQHGWTRTTPPPAPSPPCQEPDEPFDEECRALPMHTHSQQPVCPLLTPRGPLAGLLRDRVLRGLLLHPGRTQPRQEHLQEGSIGVRQMRLLRWSPHPLRGLRWQLRQVWVLPWCCVARGIALRRVFRR